MIIEHEKIFFLMKDIFLHFMHSVFFKHEKFVSEYSVTKKRWSNLRQNWFIDLNHSKTCFRIMYRLGTHKLWF